MDGPVRAKFGIIPSSVTWGGQSDAVFSSMSVAFMQDSSFQVSGLLANGSISVIVYEGALDLICTPLGAETWINNLTWSGLPAWLASANTPYAAFNGAPTGAFRKTGGGLD
jgi:serine carboxypeptidase 1